MLGLAAVMHTSALAFQALKYAGVAYLAYLAVATWRDRSAFSVDGGMASVSAAGLVMKASGPDSTRHPSPFGRRMQCRRRPEDDAG